MKLIEINYYTDILDYPNDIRKATTLEELRNILKEYKCIAYDAYEQALNMNEDLFNEYIKNAHYVTDNSVETSLIEDYLDKFGHIIIPTLMLRVSFLAHKFGAPWGVAFLQLGRTGAIAIKKIDDEYIAKIGAKKDIEENKTVFTSFFQWI